MEENNKQQYEDAYKSLMKIKMGFNFANKDNLGLYLCGEWIDMNGTFDMAYGHLSDTAAIEIVDILIEYLLKKLNNDK